VARGEAKKRMKIKALDPAELRSPCNTAPWRIKSSDELSDASWMLGQNRALEAIEFGATIDRKGYNIYVLGAAESGSLPSVMSHIEEIAAGTRNPPDWVYVHNFEDPRRPKALRLKPGRGPDLKVQMGGAISGLRETIPAIFASDEYKARIKTIEAEANTAIQRLQDRADQNNLTISTDGQSFKIIALKDGRQITDAEMDAMGLAERRHLEILIEDFEEQLQAVVERIPEWERSSDEQRQSLNEQICSHTLEQALSTVTRTFGGNQAFDAYMAQVKNAILEDIDHFGGEVEEDDITRLSLLTGTGDPFFKYEINVMCTSGEQRGSPVFHEDHPTYGRLVGSVRPSPDLSAPSLDFRSIEPGALHRANGGYLLMDVEELLSMPMGWDLLKRCMRGQSITIDTPGAWYGEYASDGLEPEPIPFDCKVVLFGDRYIHYRLQILDSEFEDHFKVVADLSEDIPRTADTELHFAQLLSMVVRSEQLRGFSADALGYLVEESSRLAEDSEKISVLIKPLKDLMIEADHRASMNAHMHVTALDVQEAVEAKIRRVDQLKERSHEFILRNFMNVETQGKVIGQLNGLVVTGLDYAFGRPSRITAKARMGNGQQTVIEQVVDIQKEVEMGGASHSKGVMILTGFLQSRYSPHQPLCLSATLAFEQSHSFVDGDSASCAELCCLMSSIGEIPLRQDLALTGAISQHGEVMAVGGVNEKIEGFFDICNARGLTGKQGVIIPHANAKDLMLRPDVVEAAAEGNFHIFSVGHVDRAMELLSGMSSGKQGRRGGFAKSTFNRKIEDRLASFENARRRATRPWRRKRL
jgi:predicted ATP-dependent protease